MNRSGRLVTAGIATAAVLLAMELPALALSARYNDFGGQGPYADSTLRVEIDWDTSIVRGKGHYYYSANDTTNTQIACDVERNGQAFNTTFVYISPDVNSRDCIVSPDLGNVSGLQAYVTRWVFVDYGGSYPTYSSPVISV
jgi:hypothetical protein